MMQHQNVSYGNARRLASCLIFGGLLLIAPQTMADKPTMNQGGSSDSGASAAPSRSSASSGSSAGSSRSSASSRSSSSGSSRASGGRSGSSRPRATAPTRSGNQSIPSGRTNVRRHRNSTDKPADYSNTTSGGRSYQGSHRNNDHRSRNRHGGHGRGYGYGYGYGNHYNHYHYSGCGHYGYSSYRYGYPYRYYGPFGYIHYRRPHVSVAGGGGYYSNEMGALDLDVRPEKAQIFVDGTLVGVADQYDGFPAYLWLEKGTYDVVIYKEGYETISRQYTVYPGVVLDVNDRMAEGTAVRPEDLFAKSTARRDERLRRNEERRAAVAQQRAGGQVELHQQSGSAEQDVARLLLNVTPSDAAAYLDGHFLGTAGELAQLSAGLIVEPGDHMLEVVRPGYETQRVPVQIPAGDKITIEVELAPR